MKEDSNMKINKSTFIFAVILLVTTSCKTSNLYLQSAKSTIDKTYGTTESNPIKLKYSKKLGYEQIVTDYIDRLHSNNLNKYQLVDMNLSTSESTPRFSKQVKEHKIVTDDGKSTHTLYFQFTRIKRRLLYSNKFGYSFLSGEK